MVSKEALHQLIDALPENELSAAERLLNELLQHDPILQALDSAPEDDEPSTPDEDLGAHEAWQEYVSGNVLSADEAKGRVSPHP